MKINNDQVIDIIGAVYNQAIKDIISKSQTLSIKDRESAIWFLKNNPYKLELHNEIIKRIIEEYEINRDILEELETVR